MNITKSISIVKNPKISTKTVICPLNDQHIWDEQKFEVINATYSGGELVILIPRTHIKLTLPNKE